MNMVVEINLETVVSCGEKDDAVLEAAVKHFKDNWYGFVCKHKDDFIVKVFCKLEE